MNPTLYAYGTLGLAIVCEVIATTFLQRSEQFTRLVPTLALTAFYGASFFLLAQALRSLPLGIAYAIWSGLGIVLTATIGVVVFRQALDAAALVGLALIVAGVAVVQLFSNAAAH